MIQLGRALCTDLAVSGRRERLVANGIGGYAPGTVSGVPTRRYHGLLVADAPGVHLTWTDAKAGDRVVTPRIGEPGTVYADVYMAQAQVPTAMTGDGSPEMSPSKDDIRYRKRFVAAVAGTILVAVCCFTPVLVLLIAAVGLGALTRYLDYVLFPALAAFFLWTIVSYRRWRTSRERQTIRVDRCIGVGPCDRRYRKRRA